MPCGAHGHTTRQPISDTDDVSVFPSSTPPTLFLPPRSALIAPCPSELSCRPVLLPHYRHGTNSRRHPDLSPATDAVLSSNANSNERCPGVPVTSMRRERAGGRRKKHVRFAEKDEYMGGEEDEYFGVEGDKDLDEEGSKYMGREGDKHLVGEGRSCDIDPVTGTECFCVNCESGGGGGSERCRECAEEAVGGLPLEGMCAAKARMSKGAPQCPDCMAESGSSVSRGSSGCGPTVESTGQAGKRVGHQGQCEDEKKQGQGQYQGQLVAIHSQRSPKQEAVAGKRLVLTTFLPENGSLV